jgi:hypothetical protein
MPESGALPLAVVDGQALDEAYQSVLRPGELVADAAGVTRMLPRFFYEVPSWEAAMDIRLAPHFRLAEFIGVDVREAEPMRFFPRYVPCAVSLLAAHLELFRQNVGTYVHITANGSYRSPAHALGAIISPHNWATAADIYRIGDDFLNKRPTLERYAKIAKELLPTCWIRPIGSSPGEADDHLHLDIGYATLVPREATGEDEDTGLLPRAQQAVTAGAETEEE